MKYDFMSGYSYAFNSPLSWSDSTGMAPEKEKKRDRVLYTLTLTDVLLEEAWNRINIEREMEACAEQIMRYDLIAGAENWCRNGMGGGGGPGPRLGQSCALVPRGWTMIGGVPTALYSVYIPSSSSDLIKIDLQVKNTSVSNGQTFQSVAQAFADGVNKILSLDAGYFDQLVGHKTTVLIKHSSEIRTDDGKPAPGLHVPLGDHESEIIIAGDVLTGNTIIKYQEFPNTYHNPSPTYVLQNYAIIAHEFGHAIHLSLLGFGEYNSLREYGILEHYAITLENKLNSLNNQPSRYNENTPPGWFGAFCLRLTGSEKMKKWDKYIKRGY